MSTLERSQPIFPWRTLASIVAAAPWALTLLMSLRWLFMLVAGNVMFPTVASTLGIVTLWFVTTGLAFAAFWVAWRVASGHRSAAFLPAIAISGALFLLLMLGD